MKLSEAIEKFTTWKAFSRREGTVATYKVLLTQFAVYMRNCEVQDVQLDHIMEYLEVMQDIGFSNQHFIKKCLALKKMFEFLYKMKISTLDYLLIPSIQREYKLPKVGNHEDFAKLIKAIPVNNDPRHIRNKAMLLMYHDTGARLSEILSLNIEDLQEGLFEVERNGKKVKVKKYFAVIKTKKSKNATPIRQIFWTDITQKQIDLWLKKRKHLEKVLREIDPDALYISTHGARGGKRFGQQGVLCMEKLYSKLAKLGYTYNTHRHRHLFGMDLAEQNVDIANIATMLGHSAIDSSRPYTILRSDGMARIYDKHMLKR